MKKQTIASHQQISSTTIAALLEQDETPLASHVSVPTGTSTSTKEQLQQMSFNFSKALNHITPIELLNLKPTMTAHHNLN